MAPKSLCSLPPELIDLICQYASQKQYWGHSIEHFAGLQKACRYLNKASRRCFLQHGYASRLIWPVPDYLTVLAHLARVDDIAASLRRITVRCPDDGLPALCDRTDGKRCPTGPISYKTRLSVLQGSEFISSLRRFTKLEEIVFTDDMASPGDHDYRPAPYVPRQYVSDLTKSFGVFIGALASAGLSPRAIRIEETHHGMMHCGLSDCGALLKYPQVSSNLQSLHLTFPPCSEDAGQHLGKQLAQTFPSLRSLRNLTLQFRMSKDASTDLLLHVSQAPALPQLRSFNLYEAHAEFTDWVAFIHKHKPTLEDFELRELRLEADSFADISAGFARLLCCEKLKAFTFWEAYVVGRAEHVLKQLVLPSCHEFRDGPLGASYRLTMLGTYELVEEAEREDEIVRLEGWMEVDTSVDVWCAEGDEEVRDDILGFVESFGGSPWEV